MSLWFPSKRDVREPSFDLLSYAGAGLGINLREHAATDHPEVDAILSRQLLRYGTLPDVVAESGPFRWLELDLSLRTFAHGRQD